MPDDWNDLDMVIAADMSALGLSGWRPWYRVTERIAYYQWLLRRVEHWERRRDPVARAMSKTLAFRLSRLGERLGFTIPRGVFGPGLSIAHRGTVVVNKGVLVGAGCRIHQGVTLGQVRGCNPRLGDRVFLGANASVIGDVTVGSDVAVGAGAVVTSDVPDGVTVGGVPARQLSPNGSADFITYQTTTNPTDAPAL